MGNLNINMKFYALLLAVVCIMSSVEANETFESSELMSQRCKAVASKFVKGWYKLDTNKNGKLTWVEMYTFYVKWAKSHNKSKAFIKQNGARVYRHWKKLAGAKHYVYWRQVWAKVSKQHKC